MSEGEVVAELVEFTNILMVGVSLIFSIVSAYVVALNYFIGSANFLARLGSFAFMTLILGMLMMAMLGAQATHMGLVARLAELDAAGEESIARYLHRRPKGGRGATTRGWYLHKRFFCESGFLRSLNG